MGISSNRFIDGIRVVAGPNPSIHLRHNLLPLFPGTREGNDSLEVMARPTSLDDEVSILAFRQHALPISRIRMRLWRDNITRGVISLRKGSRARSYQHRHQNAQIR